MKKMNLTVISFLMPLVSFAQVSNQSGYVSSVICRAVVTEHRDLFANDFYTSFKACYAEGIIGQSDSAFFVFMPTKKGFLSCEATLEQNDISKTPSVDLKCQETLPKPGMGVSN